MNVMCRVDDADELAVCSLRCFTASGTGHTGCKTWRGLAVWCRLKLPAPASDSDYPLDSDSFAILVTIALHRLVTRTTRSLNCAVSCSSHRCPTLAESFDLAAAAVRYCVYIVQGQKRLGDTHDNWGRSGVPIEVASKISKSPRQEDISNWELAPELEEGAGWEHVSPWPSPQADN